LALMFIKAVGPGSAAGVLALGFHSVGMLAKLFSEAIENLEDGPNEAVTAVGGSKFNVIMFSTLPNLMPALISNTLYRFDVSIRSASILGLVGAGGIGYPLIIALEYRQWNRVGIILIGIVIMVVTIDWISGLIRKKLV
jgi:phosphonate transport system permease protein